MSNNNSSARPAKGSLAKKPNTRTEDSLEPIVECPAELGPVAHRLWDRLVAFLAKKNVLKPVDEATLALFCQAWAGWLEAIQAIEKFGQVMTSPSGYPVQSPFVSIAKNHAETILKIAQQFGFTPASRGRAWMVASEPDAGLLELDALDLPKL